MPKRLLDDSFLNSPSIDAVSPRAQDAFPRFILLADDFGCFDANPRVLYGRGWPYREDLTPEDVAGWLDEYERAGMAFRWNANGRRWCYLTGWHGEHGQKWRDEYDGEKAPRGSKRKTPKPPGFHPVKGVGWKPNPPSEKTPSDSVPARETAGNEPGTHDFPGTQFQPHAAVAVAVPVALPAAVAVRAARLGPLGEEYRRRVAAGLQYALAPLGNDEEAATLERLLETRGVERAASWTVRTVNARPRQHRPRSLAWCVEVLADLPPRPPERPAVPPGCAEWERIKQTLREEQGAELVEHWLDPLHGKLRDGVFELVAPDEFHRAWVDETLGGDLLGLARDAFGAAVPVRIVAAAPAAPPGARATA